MCTRSEVGLRPLWPSRRGSSIAYVDALDADDATVQWRYRTDDWRRSSPSVPDGTVNVDSDDRHRYAPAAAPGNRQWRYRTGAWIDTSPTVSGGGVYVGSGDGSV